MARTTHKPNPGGQDSYSHPRNSVEVKVGDEGIRLHIELKRTTWRKILQGIRPPLIWWSIALVSGSTVVATELHQERQPSQPQSSLVLRQNT